MSARSCVFYSRFETFCFFFGFRLFVYALIANQTALHPDLIYMRNQFLTAFAIYINFAIFATKTSQLSQKISFVPLFFLLRHKKSIAKQSFVIYNNSRDGAWCSGSTWASDSHCVGSIPIAPAMCAVLKKTERENKRKAEISRDFSAFFVPKFFRKNKDPK